MNEIMTPFANLSDNESRGSCLFDYDRLMAFAEEHSEDYRAAQPFPHIVIDNFVSSAVVDELLQGFPPPDKKLQERDNTAYVDLNEKFIPAQTNKLGIRNERELHPFVRHMLWEMNSQSFVLFVEKLTGISNLLTDPRMLGGGTHQTLPGGLLRIHADFNKHRIYNLDRRLNILIYLNKDWQEEYGGHLELWDRELTACQTRLLPIASRCVIFSTNSDTWHGHPHPLTCPAGMSRKSIALYYYTNGRPAEEAHPKHRTLWPILPGEVVPEGAELDPETQPIKK